MTRKNEIIKKIMVDRRPQEALSFMLSFYADPLKQARAIYTYWSSVRQAIVHDDNNRDIEYFNKMGDIYEEASSEEDKSRIFTLTYAPLHVQHRIQIQKKPYLVSRSLDKKLKHIRPVKSEFYDFILPEEIQIEREVLQYNRDVEEQEHKRKDASFYEVSEFEAEDIIHKALEVITDENFNRDSLSDYFRNVVALQILTGRRNYEIMVSAEFQPVSGMEYQASVIGIRKKMTLSGEDEEVFTIPLLCKFGHMYKAFTRIREFSHPDHLTPSELNTAFSKDLAKATLDLFGRRLTHTQKRNIYSEMAWRKRETQNQYLIGSQSCSKQLWLTHALCHEFALSINQRYQTMSIH